MDALEEYDDIYTSSLSSAGILAPFYDHVEAEFAIDAPRAIRNLLVLVLIVPEIHDSEILEAATYLNEYYMTPFGALHAGLVVTRGERVLSAELDFGTVGLDRIPLV